MKQAAHCFTCNTGFFYDPLLEYGDFCCNRCEQRYHYDQAHKSRIMIVSIIFLLIMYAILLPFLAGGHDHENTHNNPIRTYHSGN
jgi:hypothetical protein